MKLNCDLGESFGNWQVGNDELVMPHIDMANIACGFHAGDANVMFRTLLLAQKHKVEVGAHPGYLDLQGFGRRSIPHSEQEIINSLVYQISAIVGMANTMAVEVSYVKPHGALYNDMMAKSAVRQAIFRAMQNLNQQQKRPLKLMVLATAQANELQQEAEVYGLQLLFEAFADRRYTEQGQLMSRQKTGAVLNKAEILSQVQQLVEHNRVTTESGKILAIKADTICVHGDNQEGVDLIQQIRALC